MSAASSKKLGRIMISPAVLLLLVWMIVPLALTIYFSFRSYNLLSPGNEEFIGLLNYKYFLTDPAFFAAFFNTLMLVGGVLFITIVGGVGLAVLLDQAIWGRGIVRLMVLAPFFVMPTVSAVGLGFQPFDFLASAPLFSIIIMVSWQWLPFATLILLTAIQSLDREQMEAAELDGARPAHRFIYLVIPHLSRAITAVILIETIFLLSIFAEILVTTNGGPGYDSTNISYLIYSLSLLEFDVGGGSAEKLS